MPGRKVKLVTDYYYHIVNRGVYSKDLFVEDAHYFRALDVAGYYKYAELPMSFSRLGRLHVSQQASIIENVRKNNEPLVDILAFSFMPNHIHFLLKQRSDFGISTFMGNFQNSYTRFFNTVTDRKGHIFEGAFKAVCMRSEEQLIHVFRYIILNLYSSGVISNPEELQVHPYTCLREYKDPKQSEICETDFMRNHFGDYSKLFEFVMDNASYQKNLEKIKHAILE